MNFQGLTIPSRILSLDKIPSLFFPKNTLHEIVAISGQTNTFATKPLHSCNMMDIGNTYEICEDLNEAGEWVKVPAEKVLPQWLLHDYEDIALTVPYLKKRFMQWLVETRRIEKETAAKYVRSYSSAYELLHDQVGLDLYGLLHSFLIEIPDKTKCDLTRETALTLVRIYIDAMWEILDEQNKAYTPTEQRAMLAYHDFIADLVGLPQEKLLKEKPSPLPDEDKFLSWLMSEYAKDYNNAQKIVYSVRYMNMIFKSLLPDAMTFADALRAKPELRNVETYMDFISKNKQRLFATDNASEKKTIQNGLANLRFYLLFLKNQLTP